MDTIRKVDTHHYEFECVDCGAYVFLISAYPPATPRCAVCGWLGGIEDETERAKLRAILGHTETHQEGTA